MQGKKLKILVSFCLLVIIIGALVSIAISTRDIIESVQILKNTNYNPFRDELDNYPFKENIEPLPAFLHNVHKIICIGDSITAAKYTYGLKGYVVLLDNYLRALYPKEKITVINAGIEGDRSSELVARFKPDVLDKNPQLIIISSGFNDVVQGFDGHHPNGDGKRHIEKNTYLRNVERMLDMAQQKNMNVVLLSPTIIYCPSNAKVNSLMQEYAKGLKDLAERRKIKFVNLTDAFIETSKYHEKITGTAEDILTIEGFHPNQFGQHIMADCLLTSLGVSSLSRVKLQEARRTISTSQ